MRARKKKILIAGSLIVLMFVVFYVGMFVGRVCIATKDVVFNGRIYLSLAEWMRESQYDDVQGRLDALLQQNVVATSVWAKYASGREKRQMFDNVRRIRSYYDEHHDGNIWWPSFEDGALAELIPVEEREARRLARKAFRVKYNALIRDAFARAGDPEEVHAYQEMIKRERDASTRAVHERALRRAADGRKE